MTWFNPPFTMPVDGVMVLIRTLEGDDHAMHARNLDDSQGFWVSSNGIMIAEKYVSGWRYLNPTVAGARGKAVLQLFEVYDEALQEAREELVSQLVKLVKRP